MQILRWYNSLNLVIFSDNKRDKLKKYSISLLNDKRKALKKFGINKDLVYEKKTFRLQSRTPHSFTIQTSHNPTSLQRLGTLKYIISNCIIESEYTSIKLLQSFSMCGGKRLHTLSIAPLSSAFKKDYFSKLKYILFLLNILM